MIHAQWGRARLLGLAMPLLVALALGCAPRSSAPAPAAPAAAPAGSAPSGAPAGQAAPAQARPAPQAVRVTIPAQVELGNAVIQLGVKNGYFAEEGLAPEFTLATGSIGIKALVAGEFDVSFTIGSATQAILSDAPMKVTHVILNRPLWYVYGREHVRSLKDLEGKTLGTGSISDPAHMVTAMIMERQGGDPSKVTAIGMGPPPERYKGLIAGAIDAASLIFPDNLRADEDGFRQLVAIPELFQLAMVGVTVRDDALTTKGPMLEAFMRAANKSIARFRANRDEAAGILVDVMELERATAERLHGELANMLTTNGLIDAEAQRSTIKVYGSALPDLNTDTVPSSKVFDFSIAERVARAAP
jgi:ABC-type nitrate/sulfonate/bicarbonate transport system substrate-binding protein